MAYPKQPDLNGIVGQMSLYAQLKHEYGAAGIESVFAEAEKALSACLDRMRNLPIDPELAKKEPNELRKVKARRPDGPRRLWERFDRKAYLERLEGAMLGRFAGCTLGAPVEGWPIDRMENLARENGQAFPPTEYWIKVPDPKGLRYGTSARESYTRDKMNGVPVDDDITYTLLGLLVVEDFGPRFTIAQNGQAWLKYLPYACTAEKVALDNLRKGIRAEKSGETENPYCEWIGADIRSDPWGYLAPGCPEFAADMAYRDAYVSHRRNGIYGEMFFSAAISAAFAANDAIEALEIALTEIPKECAMAKAVRWALDAAPGVRNYKEARAAMDERFKGMHFVHTINNACLTIWGLTIGGKDVSRVIGETVAMGMDNDCTAATAGSIIGAIVGKSGVPSHWTRNFNNTVHSYIIDHKEFRIDDLVERFAAQAKRVLKEA
jgi:ADP-ribosylglycohydrolase